MKAIEVNALEKFYGAKFGKKKHALKGISFSVAEGEAFGFVGQNGAGKSTTIKILTGIVFASRGSASLFGTPVTSPESRRGVGYVPENPYLYDYLTPIETLALGVRLHATDVKDVKKHSYFWLEKFGIAEVANKKIRTLSKGMTQRVALAHALACQPKLLILDEPLSGLDPVGRKEVVTILAEYKQAGGSLFFSSHVLHDVERLADRFGLIHRGELKTVDSPADLVSSHGGYMVSYRGAPAFDGSVLDGGDVACEVPRHLLWQTLEKIQASGGVLIEVRPAYSLERAYIEYVQEA